MRAISKYQKSSVRFQRHIDVSSKRVQIQSSHVMGQGEPKESSISLWHMFLRCSWLVGERSHLVRDIPAERGVEARPGEEAGPLLRTGACRYTVSHLEQHVCWDRERHVKNKGLPWRLGGKESACQCRRHGFHPWSGELPRASGHLSPCALEPMLCSKRAVRSLCPTAREEPLLAAAREKPTQQ